MQTHSSQPQLRMSIARRAVCSLLFGTSGAINALAFAYTHSSDFFINGLELVIAVAFVSGFVSGAIVAGFVGQLGDDGWPASLLAFAVATILAGLIGGSILLPVIGTMVGLYIATGPLHRPELAVPWVLCWVATHLLMRKFYPINRSLKA